MAGEDKVIGLKIDLKDSKTTLGEMQKELTRLTEQIEGVGRGSEDFKRLSKEIAQVGREVKNAELAFEALDNEQVATELGSVAGAVGDVTAAFVLMGGESEELEAVAARIETAMAVSVGFKGAIEGLSSARKLYNNLLKQGNIRERAGIILKKSYTLATRAAAFVTGLFSKSVKTTSKAFKGLRAAIMATGLGALVVIVGELFANFDKVVGAVKSAGKWLGSLVGITSEATASTSALASAQRELKEQFLRDNEESLAAFKERTEDIVEGLEHELAKRKAAGEETADIEEELLQARIRGNYEQESILSDAISRLDEEITKKEEVLGKTLTFFDREVQEDKKRLAEKKKLLEAEQEARKENLKDLELYHIGQDKEAKDAQEKQDTKAKAARDKEKERIKKNQEDVLKLLEGFKIAQENLDADTDLKKIELERKRTRVLLEAKGATHEQLAQADDYFNQLELDAIEKQQEKIAELNKANEDALRSKRALELEELKEQYVEQNEIFKEALENQLITQEEYDQLYAASRESFRVKMLEIQDEYDAAEAEKRQASALKSAEIAQAQADFEFQVAQSKISIGNSVVDAVALNVNRESKLGKSLMLFKQGLLLAEAILNAKKAIMQAKSAAITAKINLAEAKSDASKGVAKAASSAPFPANLPLIAGQVATFLPIIASVISTARSLGAAGTASTPNIPLPSTSSNAGAGGANVPQVSNSTTTFGGSTQVYVVEQDITNTQNQVLVAEQQGTL